MSWKRWLLLAVVAWFAFQQWSGRPVSRPPGVVAAQVPDQSPVADDLVFKLGEYQAKALHSFDITARVLGAEHYRKGWESTLSPVDLALGWGRMSDTAVLDEIDISQSGRFYFWKVQSFPIPRREIEQSSANMHMVPATDRLASVLKNVREGQVVRVQGYLVNITGPDGRYWNSSVTRDDTGRGACEVIYVESVDVL
ncbi:hypothetical protein [Hydrogenophaga sp. 5NK40-0174]|uniref:hypothetical protein n=1 Tax=Hydrogenophaga sp. 5NK40-0174 TaxID=3127649 RepID=UPI00310358C7